VADRERRGEERERLEKQKSPILNKIKMKCHFKMEDIDYSGEAYFLNLIKQ
jgi:hypothetical protein